MTRVTYLGNVNFRDDHRAFGIKQPDRLFHTYIIGKTGTGKTTLLKKQIQQDIEHFQGFALLDPHGDLVEAIYNSMSVLQKENTIYLDLTDLEQPYAYNPLKRVGAQHRPLVAAGLLGVFERLYKDAWGARIEHVLRYTILALLDQPKAHIGHILPMITDRNFRAAAMRHIESEEVRSFWEKEFRQFKPEMLLPVTNKIGGLMAYPVIKNFLIHNETHISLRGAMDSGKYLLVNLSKGIIGEDASHLVGSLLITSLGMAAFSRANIPEDERLPFMIYIDEFQNFTGSDIMAMLSELRKYKIGLILAHQYITQLKPEIRDAILGNIGSIISFRLGPQDAQFLAKAFYPTFEVMDFINLENYHIYLKLMIDGKMSIGFSGRT